MGTQHKDDVDRMRAIAEEALGHGQKPNFEHEIDDWVSCVDAFLSEAADAIEENGPDDVKPETVATVRECMVNAIAVLLAFVATLDKAAEAEGK